MIRKLIYEAFRALGTRETARLEAASLSPREAQLARLDDILAGGRDSSFGLDHGLSKVKSYEDFRAAVPVADYSRFQPYINRLVQGEEKVLTAEAPFMLATTSGTTGAQKFIPITAGYLKEFRRASVASGYNLFRHFPGVSNGCTLSVVSAAEEGRTPAGLPYGAISGGLYLKEPALVKRYIAPIPYEVFLIKDYEARYYALLRAALALPITSFYTLNPSTIALISRRLSAYGADLARDLFDGTVRAPGGGISKAAADAMSGLLRAQPERARLIERLVEAGECVPHRVWTDLQVVCCWTRAAASFYLADFPDYFGPTPICDITYGASEGRGTVFISPDEQMLALRSHFYEFVPEEEMESEKPTVLLADELTAGRNYYILFTTAGGLYRYNINDVVRVVGFHNRAPLIEFQYKGGNVSSFTGEKLTELQVTQAMALTLADAAARIRFFTVVPEFRPEPHYRLWVEPVDGSIDDGLVESLAGAFDRRLGECNVEYRAKRDSLRLGPVVVDEIVPGSYERLRKTLSSGGVPDSQIKISHLNPKADTLAFFADALKSAGRGLHGVASGPGEGERGSGA